jgi:hypothetical protein
LTYTVTSGHSAVSHGAESVGAGRPPVEPAAGGTNIQLATGDAILEETGTVSGLRNNGNVAAQLLVVSLAPPSGAKAIATPVVATPAD